MCFLFLNLEEVSEIFHSGGKRDLDSLFRFLFSIIIFLWMYFHMEKIEDWGFWLLANQSKIVWANQSLQKNAVFFCDWKKKNAMKYAAYLCNFIWWNCACLQKLWELAEKFRNLRKMCLTCKNCGLMKKRGKNWFPQHPVLTRLLP